MNEDQMEQDGVDCCCEGPQDPASERMELALMQLDLCRAAQGLVSEEYLEVEALDILSRALGDVEAAFKQCDLD